MVELVRHRQTKEAATDMLYLQSPRHISTLPRLCENFNVRRARRSIFEKLRDMRTDNAADIRLNAMLGNCIFYISPMYEFSHSLDSCQTHSGVLTLNGKTIEWRHNALPLGTKADRARFKGMMNAL